MTGREAILKAARGIISQTEAERINEAIGALGYVCVPKVATKEMVDEAWAYEMAENSAAVWRSMIETSEGVTAAESSG